MQVALLAVGALLSALKMTFPAGTEGRPSAIAPLGQCKEPIAFWWDESAFHAGDKSYSWKDIGCEPKDGATFKISELDLEGTLSRSASHYKIDAYGPVGNREISIRAEIEAAKDGKASVCLYAGGSKPDYLKSRDYRTLKAGERVEMSLKGHSTSSGDSLFELTDVDDRILYHNLFLFHAPELVFDFNYMWTEPENMKLYVRTSGWTDRDDYALRVRTTDLQTGIENGWAKTVRIGAIQGTRDFAFDVSDLKPGLYWMNVEYLDSADQVVHTDRARYMKPDGKAVWEGNRLGSEDTVPPPWSAPEFRPEGIFRCWNREVKLGGKGLISSIVSAGKEVLSRPVSLMLDGKSLEFTVSPAKVRKSVAGYLLQSVGADVQVRVKCEFDGFMLFEIEFPETVSSLMLNVSADRRWLSAFNDCSSDFGTTSFQGISETELVFNPNDKPYWWMVGEVGLMGGVVNLHGWHTRALDKACRMKLSETAASVETTFVDEPMDNKNGRRKVCFYLQPTPRKPKDRRFASADISKLILWTGHYTTIFECKYPGFEDEPVIDGFRKDIAGGKRVFWYVAASADSPRSPFWNWYQRDWNVDGIGQYAHEVPLLTEEDWRKGNWAYACLNSRSFLEKKVWSVDWLLRTVEESKDVYIDLANSMQCGNAHHGCGWRDDFGRWMKDWSVLSLREFQKRAYRLVKRKNPDGVMYGHNGCNHTPADTFFDLTTSGESLAYSVYRNGFTYYDVFTPEFMQNSFLPTTQEATLICLPQLARATSCFCPGRFNRNAPETVRASRHFAAYMAIHGVSNQGGSTPDNAEAACYYPVENAVRTVCGSGKHYAYYLGGDSPVRVDKPTSRFLWAYYDSPNGRLLVVLNDTDQPVSKRVTISGLSVDGKAVVEGEVVDFKTGSHQFDLGPRFAEFVMFPAPLHR